MTSSQTDHDVAAPVDDEPARPVRGRGLAVTGVIAVALLAAAVLAGIAVARSGSDGPPAAAASGPAVGGTTAPDPNRRFDVCSASEPDLERWVVAARAAHPDGEGFADVLAAQAAVVDETCPQRRSDFDQATQAGAGIRTGSGTRP